VGDGPYSDEGRSTTGCSWPWGHPGHLPEAHPADRNGAAGMLDRHLDASPERSTWLAEGIGWADLSIHDEPATAAVRVVDCLVPDCTQPATGGCEVHG
jgi:hypothetical protein